MFVGDTFEIEDGRVKCQDCGEELGDSTENIKYNLLVEEGGMENAGPEYVDTGRFVSDEMVFREYYCPNCAQLVFTEAVRKGDPPIKEFEIV
jgi:N-methylhydantoinase B